jgi:hypothetical protein
LRSVAAGVKLLDEVVGRFHARVGVTFPQAFGLYRAISKGGENDDIFSFAHEFLEYRRRSFVRWYAIARFNEVREDRAVALVLEEVTGEDGLHVD